MTGNVQRLIDAAVHIYLDNPADMQHLTDEQQQVEELQQNEQVLQMCRKAGLTEDEAEWVYHEAIEIANVILWEQVGQEMGWNTPQQYEPG